MNFLYRDDDVLYVSCGEDFISKQIKSYVDSAVLQTVDHRTSDWLTLNVGGKCFVTTRSTLTNKEPMSMLAR